MSDAVAPPDGVRPPGLDVLGEIGRGAHTVVYRVRRQGREYALKVLARDETSTGFPREAALLACLDDPALPRIFEVGAVAGRPYLVLELIDGQSLARRLEDGPLAGPELLRLGADVAGALDTAHRAGLVHRDVKPDNIMIGADGHARLIDFGLAMRDHEVGGEAVVGTLAYSAPEQTGMLKRPVDGRSDLYGLGAVLFECATGVPPFAAADAGELIRLHATAAPPDPRTLNADVGADLAGVIARLLAKDPDDRYQTADELRADLDRLRGEPAGRTRAAGTDGLVGRAEEYARLLARWDRARAGQGGVALLEGSPGAGKSRLARELTATAHAGGHLVLYGKCSPDDPVPLAPIRAAIDGYLHALGQLPERQRAAATDRLRAAAGPTAALLKPLSPALAAVLRAPDLGADDRHEQFASAVARFLGELARAEGGAALHIDDVQWLDGATQRMLQQLAAGLPEVPLLLLATARDDADSAAAVAAFRTGLGSPVEPHLTLVPLSDVDVGRLVAAQLGGPVDDTLVTALTRRTGGNPFAVQEYVRAALDAGLLRPSWGRWLLDAAGMDRLELSGDVLALVLRRIEGLGGTGRRVLAAAAAVGMRFRPALLEQVCAVDRAILQDVLGDAAARRLVETRDGGEYAFLHDRIREALLADLPPAELRDLHQRIAETLDGGPGPAAESGGPGGPDQVYAAARHYTLGDAGRHPERVYAACARAGALALADHAPAEALAFLEQAAATGIAPDVTFHRAMGIALWRNGRFGEGRESLRRALAMEPDRLQRAVVQGLISQAHVSAWEPDQALASTARALRELGRPLPGNRLLLLLTTVWSFLSGLAVAATGIGFGSATGKARERYRVQAGLYDTGAYAAAMAMRPRLQFVYSLRSLHPVTRLGPGTEYVRRLAGFGVTADVLHWHRLAQRLYDRSAAVAADLGDPTLAAHVEWKRGAGAYLGRRDHGETWIGVCERHGRWMELGDYLTGIATWCAQLVQRGHTAEADAWYQRGLARLGTGAQAEGSALTAVAIALPAQAGRPVEAARRLRPVRNFVLANPGNPSQRINLVAALMYIALEQGDHGTAFDEALAEFDRLRLRPAKLLGEQRIILAHRAFGWLARLAAAGTPAATAEAGRAVAELGRVARTPVLRAYHLVARASLAQLTGGPDRALTLLAEADRLVERLDVPVIAYEAARVRARALRAIGLAGTAERQAAVALLLATQQGWPHRARWIRSEFGVREAVTGTGSTRVSGSGLDEGRRLRALQQVSLAAAKVLDPKELTRVALDETVRILGAERAYLFLVEGDTLVPHLGRGADGAEIGELTGYSSTLVERVHQDRQAIVVTGSDEGAALGSRSAVVHGLRSIMIAPLQLDERLLGVVYLDSRVAKGVFTPDDVDLLVAITTHVAVSLETARAAQLEVDVQAASRQRDVAETLRAAMADLSAILDPDQVMRRLLETVVRVLPGDAAALLQPDGTVTMSVGRGAGSGPVPDDLLRLPDPRTGVAGPAARLLGTTGAWLAIPVAARDTPLGVVLVGADSPDPFSPAQVEIAATLTGQGLVAYENARLFSQVRRLATTDGLTGLSNRNHFFETANRLVDLARRHRRPTAALMLDIDHFKRINDTYGHGVGDEVIRTVADRLRRTCRSSDVLGRYGGEEFAVLSPETGDGAELGRRLRAAIADEPVATAAGPLAVTISVGVAATAGADAELGELLNRADAALYDAKQAGRDRVATR